MAESVVFASYARLAPGDLDTRSDIYMLDRASGRVTLESVTAAAGRIGSDCAGPASAETGGIWSSTARSPRDGQPPAIAVVLRDRVEDVNTIIAGGASGADENAWTADAAISEDGRIVVFESTMTDLVAGRDENSVARDIYLFDVPGGVLRRVSVDNAGRQSGRGFELLAGGERRRTVRGVYVHGRSRRSSRRRSPAHRPRRALRCLTSTFAIRGSTSPGG